MPPGRRLASKACDLCRARKCQCIFDDGVTNKCRKCRRGDVECTFLTGHRQRGPRLHRAPEPSIPPLTKVEIEHLCSVDVLHRLIKAFDDFVYPLLPLIDQTRSHELLDAGFYRADSAFLRRCLALCAVTVASAPNKEAEFCIDSYTTYQSFVDRACDLFMISRIATRPGWEDHPDVETAIDATLLSLAAHYAGRKRRGWTFMNEAVLAILGLGLYRAEGLAKLIPADADRCKAAFWVIHMNQIHDCFVSPIPHILPGFPPRDTDWEALQPRPVTVRDEHTARASFAHYANLFSCLRDALSEPTYRSCLTSISQHFSSLRLRTPGVASNSSHLVATSAELAFSDRLWVANGILARLREATRLGPRNSQISEGDRGHEVVAATVQLSGLYLASSMLDTIFAERPNDLVSTPMTLVDFDATVHEQGRSPDMPGEKIELWELRQSIAGNALEVLSATPREILELNGFSLIHQIRKIAASLLDCEHDYALPYIDKYSKSQFYLERFAGILADLDLNMATSAMLHDQ